VNAETLARRLTRTRYDVRTHDQHRLIRSCHHTVKGFYDTSLIDARLDAGPEIRLSRGEPRPTTMMVGLLSTASDVVASKRSPWFTRSSLPDQADRPLSLAL
jgi:hypothetical protein